MKILLLGDNDGISQILDHLDSIHVLAIIGAANRPQYHEKLCTIAKELDVPFYVQPYPHSYEYNNFITNIHSMQPDLLWINSYSMIIRNDFLAIPRLGAINIHASLLPEYRGCNPMQWTIINDEKKTGVTLHQVSEGIDAGPIIAQKEAPINFTDTWKDLRDRLREVTNSLIEENLSSILSGSWEVAQQAKNTKYYRRRNIEDGLFSWEWPLLDIYNLVRALVSPHPGAYYEGEGEGEGEGKKNVFIRQYIEPFDLTEMKYKFLTRPWQYDDLYLLPTNAFYFEIRNSINDSYVTGAGFKNIDWERRTATIDMLKYNKENAVYKLMQEFSNKEWSLQSE